MFVEVVRLFMVLLGMAAGYWVARSFGWGAGSHLEGLFGALGCLVGYLGGGVFGRLIERAVGVVERRARERPPARVVAATLGAGIGVVGAGLLAAVPVILIPAHFGLVVAGLLVWIGGFTGARIFAGQSERFVEMLGLSSRPLVRAQAFDAQDGLLVDSSVLMDGQLVTLLGAGLLNGDLLVPRFVLDEIQGFADSRDGTRARRAHRGLETLDLVRREGMARVFVLDDEVPEFDEVDAKLAALARRLQLRLLTNDAALARVAEIQGVPTTNLRRLGTELAPSVLPGDRLRLPLTRPGRDDGQAVGQLGDGSMVIVNDGEALLGAGEIDLEVTSVVPTSRGRILFARATEGETVAS